MGRRSPFPIEVAAVFALVAWLLPAVAPAQTVCIVATGLNGDPFNPAQVRTDFVSGERLSINVLLDTRETEIALDALTVTLRYPRDAIQKIVRGAQSAGTGWPLVEGVPMIASPKELPESIKPLVGAAFITVSGSAENPDCPCDAENGPDMEALVHFVVVDLQRRTFLPPGLYHVFQTDWVVTRDCSSDAFQLEVTNGPGNGLRGLGDSSKNFLRDDATGRVFELDDGLLVSGTETVEILCREDIRFRRGDPNVDGIMDVSDAIQILAFLFLGFELSCELGGDTDDNGLIDLTDAIRILFSLFLTGEDFPPPFETCDTASDVGDSLFCRRQCPLEEGPEEPPGEPGDG